MTRVRWGVLGTGWIARLQTADLILDGHEVTAVGSRSDASAARFAADFGIGRAHGSYEELVADPDVDIVYIATPHSLHRDHAVLALRAGKHVLVEKPFALTGAQADEILGTAEARGLLALEAMWTRWLPHMARIRELLEDGALGSVRQVLADTGQVMTEDPSHRINDPALGGGVLLDLGIYPVSLASMVLGVPQSFSVHARLGATGTDRAVTGVLEHSGGHSAFASAADTRSPNRATIVGTGGRIDVDPVWYGRSGFRRFDSDGALVEEWRQEVPGRGMQFQAREAEALIRAGRRDSEVMPNAETSAILHLLDGMRAQIGVRYPADDQAVPSR